MKKRVTLGILLVVTVSSSARRADAQLAVADAANLVQSTMTALKTAQTVVNTLQQIELMKSQIQNQLQTLKGLDPTSINGLMDVLNQSQLTFSMIEDDVGAIGYTVGDVNRDFSRALSPRTRPDGRTSSTPTSTATTTAGTARSPASTLAASRAQASIALLDGNNRAVLEILSTSKEATGEVRQLQLVNQQLAVIHAELASLVQNLATIGRVTSDMAAAAAGENMLGRERSRRRLDGYTSRGKPPRVLNRLPCKAPWTSTSSRRRSARSSTPSPPGRPGFSPPPVGFCAVLSSSR